MNSRKEMASQPVYDMIVVGGGPGGYTAALYAARAGLDTLVLEKLAAGGQMVLTNQIDNYPGFPEGIDGYTLGQKMKQGAERFGVTSVQTQVEGLELTAPIKRVHTDSGIYSGRTVVYAPGAEPKTLGVPGEGDWVGKGVHYCAACDGMFYRGRTVAVIGGGNSAVADALVLSRFCKEVILIHRRDTLRAERIYHDSLERAANVTFRWNSTVTELVAEDRITGLRLRDTQTGQEQLIACDGVFVSIGRAPSTEPVRGQLELDREGYVLADESTLTNLPGVYAVGDVRTKPVRQIVTATADGAVAAHQAETWLSAQEKKA